MSDSLSENPQMGSLKVVKLTSGEEVIGLISDSSKHKYTIVFPARLETFYNRDSAGQLIEFVKLTNYLTNIKGYEINIPKEVVIYMGSPTTDLEKMYETYYTTMQTDPKIVVTSGEIDNAAGAENGLQLLNELFNNEEFINFVNDLIDNYENIDMMIEEIEDVEETEETEENEVSEKETPQIDPVSEESKTPPKAKKRRIMNPEPLKLPYKPEGNPNQPESWSDNPTDYI